MGRRTPRERCALHDVELVDWAPNDSLPDLRCPYCAFLKVEKEAQRLTAALQEADAEVEGLTDNAQRQFDRAEAAEAELLSDKCVCGAKHDSVGMSGKVYERKPDCRPMTWKEVAEKNGHIAGERRKEGREAVLELSRVKEELRGVEQELAEVKALRMTNEDRRILLTEHQEERAALRTRIEEVAQELERRARVPDSDVTASVLLEIASLIHKAANDG